MKKQRSKSYRNESRFDSYDDRPRSNRRRIKQRVVERDAEENIKRLLRNDIDVDDYYGS